MLNTCAFFKQPVQAVGEDVVSNVRVLLGNVNLRSDEPQLPIPGMEGDEDTPPKEGEEETPPKEEEGEEEAKAEEGEEQAKSEEEESPTPEAGEEAPREPSAEDIERALQSPQGQQRILDHVKQMAAEAQSKQEAQETLKRASELLQKGDYEGLGKEYEGLLKAHAETVAQQKERTDKETFAVDYFYRRFLPGIAQHAGHREVLQAMTEEERREIHPDNPKFVGKSDEEYVAAYLKGIEAKRVSLSIEAEAKKLFEEWKKAQANEAVGANVSAGAGTTPGASPTKSLPNDARTLISGFFENPSEDED